LSVPTSDTRRLVPVRIRPWPSSLGLASPMLPTSYDVRIKFPMQTWFHAQVVARRWFPRKRGEPTRLASIRLFSAPSTGLPSSCSALSALDSGFPWFKFRSAWSAVYSAVNLLCVLSALCGKNSPRPRSHVRPALIRNSIILFRHDFVIFCCFSPEIHTSQFKISKIAHFYSLKMKPPPKSAIKSGQKEFYLFSSI